MPYLLIRHKVEDYDRWKKAFDDHESIRQAAGSKGGYLFRNADNSNEVVMIVEMEDLDRARQFVGSDDLRQAMEGAGVTGPPEILFLELADRPSV